MKLYTFFRSSASYRVRIALGLKGLAYDPSFVHLSRGGGEQVGAAFKAVNPQGLVPVLEDDGTRVAQSLAIIEYLEETHPTPALLPRDPGGRARVREIALVVACEIHPLNNLRVLKHLTGKLGLSEDAKNEWYKHWVALGLEALEAKLRADPATGKFCHGDVPGLADCFLVPQLFNARRFQCDLSAYPTLTRIDAACAALPSFHQAAPDAQPDKE